MKIFQPFWGDRSTGTDQEDKLPGASEKWWIWRDWNHNKWLYQGFTRFYHENWWKMMVLPGFTMKTRGKWWFYPGFSMKHWWFFMSLMIRDVGLRWNFQHQQWWFHHEKYPMYQRDELLRNCGKVSLRVSNRCSIREKEVLCFCGCINERIIFTDHFHDEETISLFFWLCFFHWIRFVMICHDQWIIRSVRRHSKPLDDARCIRTFSAQIAEFRSFHGFTPIFGGKKIEDVGSRCFLMKNSWHQWTICKYIYTYIYILYILYYIYYIISILYNIYIIYNIIYIYYIYYIYII
jgi:hypothetical protein